MKKRVDYDALASEYDHRYQDMQRTGTAAALLTFARETAADHVLEVGCGTGHWLAQLAGLVSGRFGLDFSPGMLAQAHRRTVALNLMQGRARALPFAAATFDFVYCVHAFHHFDHPRLFVTEAYRLLRPGGALAVIGMDPHGRREQWYVYHYFDGVYQQDLDRFPSWAETEKWLAAAGFTRTASRVIERIVDEHRGRAVLADPFLNKKSCSQLALLDDATYQAGIQRLEADLARAEAAGEVPLFRSEIDVGLVSGWKDV